MEERKTIIEYIEQVMKIFGFTVIVLNLLCLLFGEDAKEFSSIFGLGKEGIRISTMVQFLSVSVWITLLRFLFFTDIVIKNKGVPFRTCCMIGSVLIIMMVYIWCFQWFPIGEWLCWVMFFGSFGISFVISLGVTALKERTENRRMEEALERIKKQEENFNGICN